MNDLNRSRNALLSSATTDNDGFFPVGSTPVTCTATDINGNTGSVSFAVVVEDNVDPVFDLSTVPTSVTLEAEGPDGASFRYPTPIASDQIDPVVDVACDPESGSLFPLGTTNVLCEAVDDSGNTAVVSFSVTVVDSSAPQFGAAPDIAADAEDATGADVVYALPVANDLVDGNVAVACSPGSGARFPLGPTTVACTASDNA